MALLIIPGKKQSFDILTGHQEPEVCMATYRPGIDKSQYAKSDSHVIIVH